MRERQQNGRYPALDGLRGLAVAWVLLHHFAGQLTQGNDVIGRLLYWPQQLGWAGVDLFFVLSGFLITSILRQHRDASNYFAAFYAHRVLRIFPPLVVLLLLALIVLPKLGVAVANPPIWPSIVFLSNFGLVMPVGDVEYAGVTWSLAMEEQFYVVWSILVFMLPARSLAITAVVALLGSVALRCVLLGVYPTNLIDTFTLTHLDGLCVGALLSLAYHSPRWRQSLVLFSRTGWLWAILLVIGLVLNVRFWPPGDIGVWAYGFMMRVGLTLFALLFGAVMAAGLLRAGAIRAIFELAGLRRLGQYSYFMYLFHLPLAAPILWVAARFGMPSIGTGGLFLLVAEFAVVTTAAALSYRWFEQPILRLKRLTPYREASRVGVSQYVAARSEDTEMGATQNAP